MISLSLSLIVGLYAVFHFLWVKIIIPTFLSPLSKIPSAHFTCAFSPLWMLWKRYSEQENRTIHAAHAKHGNVVRLGPNEVSVDCVEGGIRTIYAGGFEKWNWYPNLFDNYCVPCMFSMAKSTPHSAQKRLVSNVYSKSYLQSSHDVHQISRTLIHGRLLPLLDAAATEEEPLEVLELNFAITMDFINAFIFGLGNGSNFIQEPRTRSQWLRTYQSRRAFRFWDAEMPTFKNLTRKLYFSMVPLWVDDATKFIDGWVLERCKHAATWTESLSIANDSEEDTTPAIVYDQLSSALQSPSAPPSPHPLDFRIASELQDHLAAGHETSGITLTYLFWELSHHPALQASLRQELLSLSPPLTYSKRSRGEDDEKKPAIPSAKAIDALVLLHAILMETLRLHAAIPGPQPRTTPFPPVCLGGNPALLDPGTRVSAQAYTLHRNATVFPDPETWKPARWLEADEEKKAEMLKWFWAFGSGGRMCVGNNFAMQEMKIIVAAVYTNFVTSVVDEVGIEQVDAYTAGPRANRLVLRFEHVE